MDWLWNNRPDPLLASTSDQQQIVNLVSQQAELDDPTPNLHELFQLYDLQFFDGKLGSCTVEWSKRMTTCAGICYYKPNEGLCIIRMSEKLLKLRKRSDFVETLLHEMIHAYLFVTARFADRDGHGENFQAHMRRINRLAGTNITIYHSFHAEVAVYKQHWWKCDGPCQYRAPFFGYVKRAMNRAPSKNDLWWAVHQATCNGIFQKVKEPEKPQKKAQPQLKEITSTINNTKVSTSSLDKFVKCPSCNKAVTMSQLNSHLDTCLN